MEWLLISVFLIFMGGIAVVTIDALKHASKQSHHKSIKPTR